MDGSNVAGFLALGVAGFSFLALLNRQRRSQDCPA